MVHNGRTVIPGVSMGMRNMLIPAVARGVRVGARHQVDVSCVVCGRCVHLLAVDNVIVAIADCAALETGEVGARLGLGKSQRKGNFATNYAGDELLLLLFGARCEYRRRAGSGSANSDANAGKLLFHDVLVDSTAAPDRRILRARKCRSNPAR